MTKLKPCPFCGSEAEKIIDDGIFIECTNSECRACSIKVFPGKIPFSEAEDILIEAWNRRQNDQNLDSKM